MALKIELKTEGGSVITLEDPNRVITKAVLNVEVSASDLHVYGGVPLGSAEVVELINSLRAI